MVDLKEIIKEFCEEYKLELYDNYQIEVTDISAYVKGDDTEYYFERKEFIDQAMGLLYENSNGNIVVLVRKQDCVNFISSLIHEYVHLCDYNKLSNYRNDLDYRRLQEDFVFLFWTEFHAIYLAYRYLINFNPVGLDVKNIQNEIVSDLIDYYSSSPKLDRHELMDKTVRSYGSYLALYDEFVQKVTLHPKHYYFNGQFLKLYKFLENKKTFEDFIVRFDDFKGLLLEI